MSGDRDDGILVIAASVVVTLVTANAAQTQNLAERLRASVFHAPTMLPVEVDSAIRGLERGGRLSSAQAAASRKHAAAFPVELWPWDLLADRAWQMRANLTTYDAGYVALAERLGTTLITGDQRLAASGVARCPIEVVTI